MKPSFRHAALALAVTAGVSAGVAAPAFAAGGGATLASVQARAEAAISARVTSLNAAVARVTSNSWLTSADKSTALATLNGDLSGLTALGSKIQADTTLAQAIADNKTIFTGYRVYALALPQTRLATATDDITGGVLPRLTDAKNRLAALLAGKDSGKNTSQVQAAMADLANQIQSITTATGGLSTTFLAFTPAQYDANHALLAAPRETLRNARDDIRTARADIRTVVGALK